MEHVKRLTDRIERDEYRVDPVAVADAILRRLLLQRDYSESD